MSHSSEEGDLEDRKCFDAQMSSTNLLRDSRRVVRCRIVPLEEDVAEECFGKLNAHLTGLKINQLRSCEEGAGTVGSLLRRKCFWLGSTPWSDLHVLTTEMKPFLHTMCAL